MKTLKTIALPVVISLALIIVWHFLITSILILLLAQVAMRLLGDLSQNEGFLIGVPIVYGSFLLGFLGVIPAYFSYNFLLKKLTARFGLQVDRPKRLFALSAFLIYGLPLLFFLWAIFLS